MTQKLSEEVSVNFSFDSKAKKVYPKKVLWKNRLYQIDKIGFHHTYRLGSTLFHVFSVVTSTLFMRLVLNTENLHWVLEEIDDTI